MPRGKTSSTEEVRPAFRKLVMRVATMEPDPEQYKPTKPIVEPENFFIEVDIPDDLVIRDESSAKVSRVIYSPDAISHVASVIRTALRRGYTMPIRSSK